MRFETFIVRREDCVTDGNSGLREAGSGPRREHPGSGKILEQNKDVIERFHRDLRVQGLPASRHCDHDGCSGMDQG